MSVQPRRVRWLAPAVAALILAALWEIWARNHGGLLLPTFLRTVLAMIDLAQGPLPSALWVSNQAMFGGFGLTVITAVPCGLLLGRVRTAGRVADSLLNLLMVTPMAALMPFFIMAAGVGALSRVLIVAVFAFPVVVINTRAGLLKVDRDLIDMAHAFGASEIQLWRRVLLPGAAAGVLTGLRLGLARALTGMVVVELILVAVGVGDLILRYQGEFRSDYMLAVILSVIFEAVLLVGALRRAEQRATGWMMEALPR